MRSRGAAAVSSGVGPMVLATGVTVATVLAPLLPASGDAPPSAPVCCPGFEPTSDGGCACRNALACSGQPVATIEDWQAKKGRLLTGSSPGVLVGHPNYLQAPISEGSFWHRLRFVNAAGLQGKVGPSYEATLRVTRSSADDVGFRVEVKNAWVSLIVRARRGHDRGYEFMYYEADGLDRVEGPAPTIGSGENEFTLIQTDGLVQACANGFALTPESRPLQTPAGQPRRPGSSPGLELFFTGPVGYPTEVVFRDARVESPRAPSRTPLVPPPLDPRQQ